MLPYYRRCAFCAHAYQVRVVNGPHFDVQTRPEPEITSPNPTFMFEARFRPKSQIYRVSQDMPNCRV